MTGRRQTLEEAFAWQTDHYDTSFYDALEKNSYTISGANGYTLHAELLKAPVPSDRYIILTQETVSQIQLRHHGEPGGGPESMGETEERNLVLDVPVRHKTAHDHGVPEIHFFRVRRVAAEIEDGLDREVLSEGEGRFDAAHHAEVGLDGVSPLE